MSFERQAGQWPAMKPPERKPPIPPVMKEAGEFRAVKVPPREGPLTKPPEGYRDPSEFPGAEKPTTLEKVRMGAAVEKAREEQTKKEEDLKERQLQFKKWIEGFVGQSPKAVTKKLYEQFDNAKDAGGERKILGDVSEALYRLRHLQTRENPLIQDTIKGMENFLEEQSLVVSLGAKETERQLRQEERVREKAARSDTQEIDVKEVREAVAKQRAARGTRRGTGTENYAQEMPAVKRTTGGED